MFKRFIVIRNPKSTNARRAEHQIAELRTLSPDGTVTVIETCPGGHAANCHLLRPYATLLGKDTLICVAAGDGTFNLVLDSLLNDTALPARARNSSLLPLWGGNANDLARALNGSHRAPSLKALLQSVRPIMVYPLACQLAAPDGETMQRLAASYIGFGASAFVTEALSRLVRKSRPWHQLPTGRLTEEMLVTLWALHRAPTFTIAENGKSRTVFEYICFNGSRFAKVFGVRQRLSDRSFHRAVIERKDLSTLITTMRALNRADQTDTFSATHVNFTVTSDTWAQFDGESLTIPAGTTVEILPAEQPFYTLTTSTDL